VVSSLAYPGVVFVIVVVIVNVVIAVNGRGRRQILNRRFAGP
jgi:hypothetical protein